MSRKILDVPKIKQLRTHCGPTSVAMVLNYYSIPVTQKEVANRIRRLGHGFCDQDILPYVRSKGLVVHPYKEFSIDGLVRLINRGIPPIVRTVYHQDPDLAHLSVIKGYDLSNKILFFNDPADLRKSKMDFEIFETIWLVNNNQGYSKNYTISIHPR